MGIKIIIFVLVVILLMIAALLFTIAVLCLKAPMLLIGQFSPAIVVGCITSGMIILLPIVIFAIIQISNMIFILKNKTQKNAKKIYKHGKNHG